MLDYLHLGRSADLADLKDRRIYRALEIMPGLLAWVTIALIIVLSFLLPLWVAVFIIIFDVYWLIKTVYLSLHLRISYNKLKENMKTNWLDRLRELRITNYKLRIKSWEEIYHLIFLPLYKEDFTLVSASMESLLKTNYPKDKMIVVLCWEERGGEETERTAREIENLYANKFHRFLSVIHPASLPNELAGKGSNTAYAAAVVKDQIVDKYSIPYHHILVSNLDIDTVVFPEYLGVLTHTFLTTDNPLRASYQPVPLYINNIWEAPSFARVVAFSATFWHTIKQEKHETATTLCPGKPWLMSASGKKIWFQKILEYFGSVFCDMTVTIELYLCIIRFQWMLMLLIPPGRHLKTFTSNNDAGAMALKMFHTSFLDLSKIKPSLNLKNGATDLQLLKDSIPGPLML